MACMWKEEESTKKKPFLQNLHWDITLGNNVIKKAFKWKSKWVRTRLTSTIEVLREEAELNNTRTASVMHIPNWVSPRQETNVIGFGASCGEEVFDIIGTLKQIPNQDTAGAIKLKAGKMINVWVFL